MQNKNKMKLLLSNDVTLSDKTLKNNIKKLNENILKKNHENISLTYKCKKLQEIIKNIGSNHRISYRIILDVKDLLKEYISYVDEIDAIVNKLSTYDLDDDKVRLQQIQSLITSQITHFSKQFKSHLKLLKPAYEQHNIKDYEQLLSKLS